MHAIGATTSTLFPRRVLAAAAVAALSAIALGACSSGGHGVRIPAGFPSDVPLVSGTLLRGSQIGPTKSAIWDIRIAAAGDSTITAAAKQLRADHYSVYVVSTSHGQDSSLVATSVTHTVEVGLVRQGGSEAIDYTVSQSSDGG